MRDWAWWGTTSGQSSASFVIILPLSRAKPLELVLSAASRRAGKGAQGSSRNVPRPRREHEDPCCAGVFRLADSLGGCLGSPPLVFASGNE